MEHLLNGELRKIYEQELGTCTDIDKTSPMLNPNATPFETEGLNIEQGTKHPDAVFTKLDVSNNGLKVNNQMQGNPTVLKPDVTKLPVSATPWPDAKGTFIEQSSSSNVTLPSASEGETQFNSASDSKQQSPQTRDPFADIDPFKEFLKIQQNRLS